MSGQDGARGYYFQAIIAVLDSLNQPWENVCIEPNLNPDKVDIIWTYSNNEVTVNQVKSSINNFNKTEILSYLLELKNCYKNAYEYRLTLIGNCTGPTKKYFNNINKILKKDLDKKYSSLYGIRHKIKVEIQPFELNTLESAIKSNLHKFLSSKSYNINYTHIELIAEGLINQFSRFATKGQSQTKSQFEDSIIRWVNFNYSDFLNKKSNTLDLRFYLSSVLDFTEELPIMKFPDLSTLTFIENKKSNTLAIIEKLKLIKLKKEPKQSFNNTDPFIAALGLQSGKLHLPDKVEVVISNDRRNIIKQNAEEVFALTIDESIFEFGDLKTGSVFIAMPFGPDNALYGTDKEKEKYKLFVEFESSVKSLFDLLSFLSKLQNYQILPLILRNNGEQFNESIRILLHVPKKVEVLMPERFPIPSILQNLEDMNNYDSYLFYFLHHHKDSKVLQYNNRSILPIYDSYLPFRETEEQKLSKERKRFKSLIEHYFDFDVFTDDNPDFLILSCDIDELNPHDAISLPCFLLIKANEDFSIDYEINSKYLNNKISDSLKIQIVSR